MADETTRLPLQADGAEDVTDLSQSQRRDATETTTEAGSPASAIHAVEQETDATDEARPDDPEKATDTTAKGGSHSGRTRLQADSGQFIHDPFSGGIDGPPDHVHVERLSPVANASSPEAFGADRKLDRQVERSYSWNPMTDPGPIVPEPGSDDESMPRAYTLDNEPQVAPQDQGNTSQHREAQEAEDLARRVDQRSVSESETLTARPFNEGRAEAMASERNQRPKPRRDGNVNNSTLAALREALVAMAQLRRQVAAQRAEMDQLRAGFREFNRRTRQTSRTALQR